MGFVQLLLNFFANWQIEIMSLCLFCALVFRWFAYKASKHDQLYFSTFIRELELQLEKNRTSKDRIDDVGGYMDGLMEHIQKKLPSRNFRIKNQEDGGERLGGGKAVSLKDYLGGKQGLVYSIQEETNVFQCKTPPNFSEFTKRVMGRDKNWNNLFGVIPIESVSRMIDVLPGLFIVLGVFGTFIGVAMALPEIAKLDFQNIESSGDMLNRFVTNISFSMNTSIAGIFYSVTLTLLNTLYPIKGRRDAILKQVESSLELLWYHVHRESGGERDMAQILERLARALEAFAPKTQAQEEDEEASPPMPKAG